MNRSVYKLRPSDFWRIGEHESWFTDMAARGFFLKKMGIHFARFEQGEPRDMRYRIEVSINKRIPAEQIEMYRESGWNYVTSYGHFHVFSSPAELDAPELHTDPAEQSYTLKELDKKLAWNAGSAVIGMILMFAMMFSIWFLDGTPTYILVDGSMITQTFLTIFLAYTAYHSLRAALSIRDLRKKLVEGKHIDHQASWKKHHRIHTAAAFLFTVVVGLGAIIPFVQLSKMETVTLPEGSIDLPIVRLADVENDPNMVREEAGYMSDDVDWGNRLTSEWSLMAPVKYESDESGVVPGKLWEDLSGEYSPSIHTEYYQLRFPSMAENLVTDLVERYRYDNSLDDYVEKKHPDLDLLVVYTEEDMNKVFAAKGDSVMYVRYHGYADVDKVIEHVVEKIR